MSKKHDIVNLACNIVSSGLTNEEVIELIENLSMIVLNKSPQSFSNITEAVACAYECMLSSRVNDQLEADISA